LAIASSARLGANGAVERFQAGDTFGL